MHKQLVEFYVQFHQEQHYFLCHDILEEAWKAQNEFSKHDPVVSLILVATGCYHYRRGNFKGAHRSFKKALKTLQRFDSTVYSQLGLQYHLFQQEVSQLILDAENEIPFSPIMLPLTDEMTDEILKYYPHYRPTTTINATPFILHHHKLRDRAEVIAARAQAQHNKKR